MTNSSYTPYPFEFNLKENEIKASYGSLEYTGDLMIVTSTSQDFKDFFNAEAIFFRFNDEHLDMRDSNNNILPTSEIQKHLIGGFKKIIKAQGNIIFNN